MKITLITVGKLKSKGGFCELDTFYRDRIKPYCRLDVVELKEKGDIVSETESIKRSIPEGSFLIALREDGEVFNSVNFSKLIERTLEACGDICFVIGGAYGYSDVGEKFSLSIASWTLPHQLARIVLLEQIYRGLSIIKGSKYHHSNFT